jgi:hypothetical protein
LVWENQSARPVALPAFTFNLPQAMRGQENVVKADISTMMELTGQYLSHNAVSSARQGRSSKRMSLVEAARRATIMPPAMQKIHGWIRMIHSPYFSSQIQFGACGARDSSLLHASRV